MRMLEKKRKSCEAVRVSLVSTRVGTKTDASNLDTITALSRRLRNKGRLAYFLISYGRIALSFGNLEDAYASFSRSIEIGAEIGHRLVYFYARTHLAYLFFQQGETTSAREIFLDSAQNFQHDQNIIGVAFALEGIASVFILSAKHLHAARLIGWADGTREKVNASRPPTEQRDVDKTVTACLAKLGEVAFTDAYEEGKQLSLEEAVAYALEES